MALKHASPGVRRNAVQVLPRETPDRLRRILAANLLRDPDPQVRLAAFLSLADQPTSDQAGVAVAEAVRSGVAASDASLADAAMAAGAKNAEAFLKAVVRKGKVPAVDPVVRVAERIAEHWARGGPTESVGGLLGALVGGEPYVNEAILRGMTRGWPKGRPGRIDAATGEALTKLTTELTPTARAQLVRLVGSWGDQALDRLGHEIAATLLASVKNEKLAESQPHRRRASAHRASFQRRRGCQRAT